MSNQPQGVLRIHNEEDFYRLFAWEVQRATRYQDFLSLCLIRPDHSGAPRAGLLSAVAQRVVELLRSTDLVGMIDDTIAVALVHTPDSDAALIMERLRGHVESHAFGVVPGEHDVVPAVSLGLAEFPTDATTDGSLFAHARTRLAEAWGARRRSPEVS